jgi:protein PhnA
MIPNCPKCGSQYVYEDGELFICPECGFEFDKEYEAQEGLVVIDAYGNRLQEGDDVIVIKDLKFKGGVVKGGTKVKNIRLCEGDHNIDCKVPGIGGMKLKSEFVKKV